jgi:hypothetical protein
MQAFRDTARASDEEGDDALTDDVDRRHEPCYVATTFHVQSLAH